MTAIGAGAWMFVANPFAADEQPRRPDRTTAQSVLSIPADDSKLDARRRGAAGRDRIDEDAIVSDAPSLDARADATLPAVFSSLDGRRIALAGTVYATPGARSRTVRIGGLQLACPAPASHQPDGEDELLAAIRDVLDRAGSSVTIIADGPRACVDDRVRTLERSTDAIVVRVDAGVTSQVLAGYPARSSTAADRARARTLAGEVAAQLGLKVRDASTKRLRQLLASAGAVDLPGGGSIVLVELGRDADRDVQDVAMRIARALAIRAASADAA